MAVSLVILILAAITTSLVSNAVVPSDDTFSRNLAKYTKASKFCSRADPSSRVTLLSDPVINSRNREKFKKFFCCIAKRMGFYDQNDNFDEKAFLEYVTNSGVEIGEKKARKVFEKCNKKSASPQERVVWFMECSGFWSSDRVKCTDPEACL